MASIDSHPRPGMTQPRAAKTSFSAPALIALAIAALAIGTMVLGSVVGIFSGGEPTPIASNDGAPVIGVNDPNIVVEEPQGDPAAPLSREGQGTTMTTVPTNPVDETE